MNAAELIRDAFHSGTCRLLVLSQPQEPERAAVHKATWRPIEVRGRKLYQVTRQSRTQAFHDNQTPESAADEALSAATSTFRQLTLCTDEANFAMHRRDDGTYRVRKLPASQPREIEPHNRPKPYLLPEGVPCEFLEAIDVMTAEGTVRRSMYHKFRQINRYLELVNDVVPQLPADREIHVVDFGCGKSSLTFALHHLLTAVHQHRANIVGLDRNAEIVRDCQNLSKRLECRGLSFAEGTIAEFRPDGPVDLAVSLHACDTATDDALAKAVEWNCSVILAVPCCQHEFAPQLTNADLTPLLAHGILRERLGALATDAWRAALLELVGYRTQVLEFIDLEHTPKNLLIRAVRRQGGVPHIERLLSEAEACKRSLGVQTSRLEDLLRDRLPRPTHDA